MDSEEHRYERLTWSEVDAAAEAGTLVLIPVGSTEDHGPHLPLDVDRVIPTAICDAVAEDSDGVLRFPPIDQGYLPHHMDYPGGVTIGWETFVNHLIDVANSLTHHGFRKLLFVNGHGSNHHLVQQAARQTIIQSPEAQAAMLSWWELEPLRERVADLREGGPRSTGHAGELETSVYLHLHPERVDMDAAVRDVAYPDSPHFYSEDLVGERPEGASTAVSMQEWWSTISETGVRGDATVATAEKGREFFAAAVAGLEEVVEGFRAYPFRGIEDKHAAGRAPRDYDRFRPR